jgi:hypothetical protein
MPWLACGTVAALAWLARPVRGATTPGVARSLPFALVILLAAGFAQWRWGPFTARAGALPVKRPERVLSDGHDRAMRPWRDEAIRAIGDRDGIVSGFETLQRFHDRTHVYAAHHVLGGVYSFSDIRFPLPRGVNAGIVDTGVEMTMDWIDSGSPRRWRELARMNGLVPVAEHGDLTLWLRGAGDTLELVSPGPVVAPLAQPISYEDRVRLLGVALPAGAVSAGGEIPMVFCWQRHGAIDGSVELGLALTPLDGTDDTKRAVHSRFLGYGLWGAGDWEQDVVMQERYRWVMPDDLPPGRYRVGIAAAERRKEEGLRPFATNRRTDADGFIGIGEITIAARGAGR